MSLKRTEGGYKRANPYADPGNAVKLAACAPCEGAICEDYAEVELGENLIAGFVYSETSEPIMFSEPISPSDWEMSFCDSVQNVQTEEGMATFEFSILTSATTEGTVTTISHIGQTVVSAIILTDGSQVSLERRCNLITVCKYEQFYVGTGAQLVYGDSTKLLSGTFSYVKGDDVANETTAASLANALTACLDSLEVDYESVDVFPDDLSEGFSLVINAQPILDLYIGQKKFENCGCDRCFAPDEDMEEGFKVNVEGKKMDERVTDQQAKKANKPKDKEVNKSSQSDK